MHINKRAETWYKPGTSMWFFEFMQQALYHPTLGYYTRASSPFGKAGDFVTAPELTPLFGYTLARAIAPVLASLEAPRVFEFGAGSGRLCVDILTALEQASQLPHSYVILEVSQALKTQQAALIKQQVPHLLSRVSWIDSWPDAPFQGVVIANEVLDAMPVHRFKAEGGQIFESRMTFTGRWHETWMPCETKRIIQHIQSRLPDLTGPYLSECNGLLQDWLQHCSRMLDQGALLLIDYGFPAKEYYHPDRHMGTLMCHYQHQAHGDFLDNVGEQDITAHVDFTHIAECAVTADLDVAWYGNQASFLLEYGLLDMLSSLTDPASRFEANQKVAKLLSPSEMGELFKVMVLTKALRDSSHWDSQYDKRGSL